MAKEMREMGLREDEYVEKDWGKGEMSCPNVQICKIWGRQEHQSKKKDAAENSGL